MGAMKWILLACILGFPGRGRAQDRLYPDSEAVVLRIYNFNRTPVTVYLDPVDGKRRTVTSVIPGHEVYWIFPSRDCKKLTDFFVTIVPADPIIRPYRTGLLHRIPGKLLMLFMEVGQRPDSSTSTTRS